VLPNSSSQLHVPFGILAVHQTQMEVVLYVEAYGGCSGIILDHLLSAPS